MNSETNNATNREKEEKKGGKKEGRRERRKKGGEEGRTRSDEAAMRSFDNGLWYVSVMSLSLSLICFSYVLQVVLSRQYLYSRRLDIQCSVYLLFRCARNTRYKISST
jgi:hypothetical protein